MAEDSRLRLAPLILLPGVALLGLLLSQCGGWNEVGTPPDDPFGDDDDAATPADTVEVVPEIGSEPVLNPDAGWVAYNPNQSWTSLVARAGGEPFRVASVIYTRVDSAGWAAPTNGSNPDLVATGSVAGQVAEAMEHGRYAAFRVHATTSEDLPSGWPTTTAPAELVPDGVISLILVSGSVGDDDDSAGDDDDSAGDDDDSASTGRDDPVWAPDYSDPDYRDLHSAQVAALADRFAGEPGLAFVDIGGVGEAGGWDFEDPALWFSGADPVFNEVSWAATVQFYADLYEGLFPGVPLYISWRAVANAGAASSDVLQALTSRGIHLRDDCVGCAEPDFDRFPEEGSDDPYPSSDPFGGWLPAELWPDHAMQYEAIDAGFGSWRLADADGEWDEGLHGPFEDWFRRMLDVRIRYAPPSLAGLSSTACTSEWVIAADPPASACGSQTPGAVWAPLQEYGEQLGYRYEVTSVRLRPDWDQADDLAVELEVVNRGAARAFADRGVELAFVEVDGDRTSTPVALVLPSPTSEWLPGQQIALSVVLSTEELSFGDDVLGWTLTIRVLEPRAFGGGIALPHPPVGDEARYALATWPFPE